MHPALPQYDVGVLIGRFQVHELHDAHRDLIQYVVDRHDKVLILLGVAPIPVSTNNPLDFQSRAQMILAEFPNVVVQYVNDTKEDSTWARRVDMQVRNFLSVGQTAVVYGGRDSFIPHYEVGGGKFPTVELTQETFQSGTAVRKKIAASSPWNEAAYRAGVIKASLSKFPVSYQVVDVAVWQDADAGKAILMARREGEKLLRFFGGFVDPADPSLEHAAKREVGEEANGIEVADIRYVGSANVPDWRYNNEPDCIKTALFTAKFVFGRPVPTDDMEGGETTWRYLDSLKPTEVVPEHRHLLEMLKDKGFR